MALAKERLARYSIDVVQKELELEEIQSMSVVTVAKKKAEQAMRELQVPFIVEDSGLYLSALHGFPGALVKLVIATLGEERLTHLLNANDERSAEVVGVLVYGDPDTGEMKVFEGIYRGFLAECPRGEFSRGWLLTRMFIAGNGGKTLAELNDDEWRDFLLRFRHEDHFELFAGWYSKNG